MKQLPERLAQLQHARVRQVHGRFAAPFRDLRIGNTQQFSALGFNPARFHLPDQRRWMPDFDICLHRVSELRTSVRTRKILPTNSNARCPS